MSDKNNVRILVVEDDDNMFLPYSDITETFNSKSESHNLVLIRSKNLDEAKSLIQKEFFDAAIVDLVLERGLVDGEEIEGISIIKEIVNKLRFPIFIYSGNLPLIGSSVEENIFLKKYSRDQVEFNQILTEILIVYDTGITEILGEKGIVERYLDEIFWQHLSNSLEYWFGIEDAKRVLFRYISSYIQEYLDWNESGELDNYLPAEYYIEPPVKKDFYTGDIISFDGKLHVILTPSCDIIVRKDKEGNPYRKSDKILLLEIVDWRLVNNFRLLNSESGSNKKSVLKDYISNKKERYHYLPQYKDIPSSFIDFQSQLAIPFEKLDVNDRIATITHHFLKDIIARFSQYYSRQGQPDLNSDEICTELLKQNDS